MRGLGLLITILLSSYTCISQTLKPIVQLQDKDTLFCFTISQSKLLARKIEAGIWCDSLVVKQEDQLRLLAQSIEVKDSVIDRLALKTVNLELLYHNKQTESQLLDKTIVLQEKQLKRGKRHKILMGIGLGILSVLIIAN